MGCHDDMGGVGCPRSFSGGECHRAPAPAFIGFQGGQDWLASLGVEVIDLVDATCQKLLSSWIVDNPDVWNEDIGVGVGSE